MIGRKKDSIVRHQDKSTTPTAAPNTSIDIAQGYAGFEGLGYENQTDSSWIDVDRITLTQDDSLPVRDGTAEPGRMRSSITGESSEFLECTPLYIRRSYVAWDGPAGSAAKPVATYEANDRVVMEAMARNREDPRAAFHELYTENGDRLQETWDLFLMLNDGRVCVFSASKTKIPIVKRANQMQRAFRLEGPGGYRSVPMCAHRIRLSSYKHLDKRYGKEYYKLRIDPAHGSIAESLHDPQSDIFLQAADATRQIVEGAMRVSDMSSDDDGDGAPF